MSPATSQPSASAGLTFEGYMALPETLRRQEVLDGVIVMSPAPTFEHQWVLGNLYRTLFDFVSTRALGAVALAPFDILIRKHPRLRTRQPDLVFFSGRRVSLEELKRTRIVEVAPDLAIEIRSEEETEASWAEKLADYTSIQVPEVWRVFLEIDSVEVLALNAGRYERIGPYSKGDAVRSQVLPDLALPVESIFR